MFTLFAHAGHEHTNEEKTETTEVATTTATVDYTPLYIGAGVIGVVVVGAVIYMLFTRRTKPAQEAAKK